MRIRPLTRREIERIRQRNIRDRLRYEEWREEKEKFRAEDPSWANAVLQELRDANEAKNGLRQAPTLRGEAGLGGTLHALSQVHE